MANSDALFLFELYLEDIKKYTKEEVIIKCNFSNIFEFHLKQPNEKIHKPKKKFKRKKNYTEIEPQTTKVQSGQSTLYASTFEKLMNEMKNYPLQLSVTLKKPLMQLLGTTEIPWSKEYFEYLHLLSVDMKAVPVSLCGEYMVCNKSNSKRLALVKIRVKLSYLPTDTKKLNNEIEVLNDITSKINVSIESFDYCKDLAVRKIEESFANEINKIRKSPRNLFSSLCTLSDTNIIMRKKGIMITKSVSDLPRKNILNDYIFWNNFMDLPKLSYCVGYAVVKCGSKCSADHSKFPTEGKPLRIVQDPCTGKCFEKSCETKGSLPVPDNRIFLDYSKLGLVCCTDKVNKPKKNEKGNTPCDCVCDCVLGFKKTTFCSTCGGYEELGEDSVEKKFPCPIFHKLVDLKKLKTYGSQDGSDKGISRTRKGDKKNVATKAATEKNVDKASKNLESNKARTEKNTDTKARLDKNVETNKASTEKSYDSDNASSSKGSKSSKKKKKLKDPRFIFNYGYTAPKIGHLLCKEPCGGPAGVPKHMGWQWDSKHIVGLKYRPNWKPGAASKRVVRLLKIAKDPEEGGGGKKRKKKDLKKKKNEKIPQLVVHKVNGEFNVTMQVMKTFIKPRLFNQNPFEETPLHYVIGRTDEENYLRNKKKERRKRRLAREQREYIQSVFKNLCKDICLKSYQQALGVLNDTEDPECTCFFPHLELDKAYADDHSCSCSEDENLSELDSASDNDEWILEFTPPTAKFDPNSNVPKITKVDNETQYTYLDYRVKLLDRFGNQVPRFFKGPTGKTECSDLGGFYGPDNKWLTINVDGFIGADKKWAPMYFMGPGGERVEAVNEKFQTSTGDWLVVGVDGYVNAEGVWCFYKKALKGQKKQESHNAQRANAADTYKQKSSKSPGNIEKTNTPAGGRGGISKSRPDSTKSKNIPINVTTVSSRCFGDTSLHELNERGITGHGHDRKLLSPGKPNRIPLGPKVPKIKGSEGTSIKYDSRSYFLDRTKCHHSIPSTKGIIASDGFHKTYFRIKPPNKNKRFREKVLALEDCGITISSSHVPCLHSFINSQVLHEEIRQRLDRNYGHLA